MGIIKASNVRSEFTAAYRVTGAPTWEKMGPYKNSDDEEFFNVFYSLPIVEVYPNDDPSRERRVRIKTSRSQAEAIMANLDGGQEQVTMHSSSQLGQFAKSAATAGLKVDVDDDAMQDRILVLTNESTVNATGWRDVRWTVKAYLGTTNDYDPNKVKMVVDGFNEGAKQAVASY